jgi:hypothetical protein
VSRLFISHASANNAQALALARWLADNGWDDYFLDVSPARGLAPGERWQEALKAAADRCEAVLFLLSPAWLASTWCGDEFRLAKDLNKAVFGVLIETVLFDALPQELTGEWQLCDLVSGTERVPFQVAQDPVVPETTVSGRRRLRPLSPRPPLTPPAQGQTNHGPRGATRITPDPGCTAITVRRLTSRPEKSTGLNRK